MNKEVKITKKVIIIYIVILTILSLLLVFIRFFNGDKIIINFLNKETIDSNINETNEVLEHKKETKEEVNEIKENIKTEEIVTEENKKINESNTIVPKEEIIENNIPNVVVKTEEQINDEYRKSVEQLYGINIKYGSELGNYLIYGQIPTPVTDNDVIMKALKDMNNYLSYYPKGMFREIKNSGIDLSFYIVKTIPNTSVAGIADYEFGDRIKITLSTDSFFFRVIHHEIYHYMEKYMSFGSYPNEVYPNWNTLNPNSFVYGDFNSEYSYNMINNLKGAYFINNYGQTNEREDRATIFEDMMARASKPKGCYDKDEQIWKKAKYISETIDKHFNTVNSNVIERWERFVY